MELDERSALPQVTCLTHISHDDHVVVRSKRAPFDAGSPKAKSHDYCYDDCEDDHPYQ